MNRALGIESLLYEPLAEYDSATDTFLPVLAKDWTFDTGSLTITLRDGYEWHDGTAIDGSDLERQFSIDGELDPEYWAIIESITSSGQTVTVQFDGQINESVLAFDLLQRRLHDAPEQFAVGGTNQEPIDPVDAVGSGPYEITSVTDDEIELSLYDAHPDASKIEIDVFVFEERSSESEQWAGLADGDLSGSGSAFYPDQFRTFEGATPVDDLTAVTTPSDAGWGIVLNHRHPLLSDRRVRKAIAHVFSSADAVTGLDDTLPEVIELQTGIAPERTQEYLAGEMGRFETYGDTKRAAELLGQAGFGRTWEQWLDPRGDPAEFGFVIDGNPHADDGNCLGAAEPGWFYGAREFVTQLSTFLGDQSGPSAAVVEADATEGFSGVGPHDDVFAFLPARQWGQFDGAHPYHSYRSDLLLREASLLGYGPQVEVPAYDEPSGQPETVDIRELLDGLRRAASGSTEEQELVRELAWVVNQTVPYLQGYYRPSVAYLDATAWDATETGVSSEPFDLARNEDLRSTDH